MEQTEGFKDWLFRYQYVYRLRRTEKSKKRFLAALVTDIAKMRKDVRVIEYDQQKNTRREMSMLVISNKQIASFAPSMILLLKVLVRISYLIGKTKRRRRPSLFC